MAVPPGRARGADRGAGREGELRLPVDGPGQQPVGIPHRHDAAGYHAAGERIALAKVATEIRFLVEDEPEAIGAVEGLPGDAAPDPAGIREQVIPLTENDLVSPPRGPSGSSPWAGSWTRTGCSG